MQINLDNQVAVVTGGSRGIGAATVKAFAEAGARVVFSYRRNAKSAKAVIREINAPDRIRAVRADVASMSDAKALVETAIREFGRLDVLVANAGVWNADLAPIERLTEKQWEEMIAVNLKGVYAVIHQAVPLMIKRKQGAIIAISSTAGQRGEAFHSHYAAAKGGIISMVKGLSTELAPHNIRVNCVAPGWVDTDMAASVTGNPDTFRKKIAVIPLGRFGRPEEIARPILFLASEMASYITGEIMNVNGGSVLCG